MEIKVKNPHNILIPDIFLKIRRIEKNTNFGKMLLTNKTQHIYERRCFL